MQMLDGEIFDNFSGRFELRRPKDDVGYLICDGSSNTGINEELPGQECLTFKLQLAGAGEYHFGAGPDMTADGECLVVAHQPIGVVKRQVIPKAVQDRSVTVFFPRTANGGIAGCEVGSREVQAATAFLSQRLLFQRHEIPRAAVHCTAAILSLRRSPWAQERYKRAKTDELSCLMLDFFLSQFRTTQDHGLMDREVRRVQQARAIISERFDAPPSVADLSRSVGLNRTRLTAAFKAFYGETVGEAVQRERMACAQSLLSEGGHSVSEVAERCGYGHLSNFSLAYKAFHGVSPSVARDGPAKIVRPE
ncbi:helix-turn-helix transcriptional regulator [Phenylobacterium sp.]|uniref:helix-turn-helix transcriptional regulator n=1 Tax=Phenylobacterium sp. TaxID=1871053 RepID=UPI00356354DE